MPHREIVETRGDYRAVIEVDEIPDEPDWDGQSYIIQVGDDYGDYPRIDIRHVDSVKDNAEHREAEVIAHALGKAWDRRGYFGRKHRDRRSGMDWELTERYLRTFFDVVSFDHMPWDRDGHLVAVTTKQLAASWGFDDPTADNFREHVPPSAEQALTEWRLYGEGDVWIIGVEKRVVWHRDDDPEQTRETWEWVEDSPVGGFYGSQYAIEEVKGMLAAEVGEPTDS